MKQPGTGTVSVQTARAACVRVGAEAPRAATEGRVNTTWAELMARVFEEDVLECRRCGGRLKCVATIVEGTAIRAILECIGLPARAPPLTPARGPWQGQLDFDC